MGTPLYTTDIIPLTSRPTLTVMDDGDYFVILDTSTGKISKILKTLAMEALKISYDNSTSGLTAENVQAALDELVVNLGSSDSAISALGGRLNVLEADDTTEGSVAKTVKDAVEPIIEDVSDHETRLDTTELTLARQGQDLASVKQTLQQGNGATLDFSGIGSVSLDARATGRANPTAKGLTATNLLGEQGNFETVGDWVSQGSFAVLTVSDNVLTVQNSLVSTQARAVIEDIYSYSTGKKMFVQAWMRATSVLVSNLIIRITATGIADQEVFQSSPVLNQWYLVMGIITLPAGGTSDISFNLVYQTTSTSTEYVGQAKEAVFVDLTSTFGASNEPTPSDCAKLFSYFDGTKSIQLPARIISKSEEESESSTLYIADNEELRSVPEISDEVKVVNGQLVKVQRVQRYVLQASDITNLELANGTNRDYIIFTKSIRFPDSSTWTNAVEGKLYISTIAKEVTMADSTIWDGVFNGYTFGTSASYLYILFPRGTYATIAEAQADLAGTVIYYQLATPIITPLLTSGILQAKPNGSVYYEPYYEGSHQTNASSQITLPYEGTIEAVYGYDEDLVEYLLDSSEYSLTGTTLTITGALENEVFYVQMSRSEPLAPEMSVNVLNNDQVTLDTNDGKYYQIGFTTTNGMPTVTATEVV